MRVFSSVSVCFMVSCMGTLAACGGGGGGSGGAPATIPAPAPQPAGGPTTSAKLAATQAQLSAFADPVIYTDIGAVPVTGSARYDGYAYGSLANTSDAITDSLIGDITMNVTFGTAISVSGQIDDLVDDDDAALTGTLALSGGTLDRGGNPSANPTMQVTVSGALTDGNGRTLDVGALLEGDFLGTGHAAVGGDFLGTVTVSGTPQDLNGGFIAQR